MNDHGDLNLGDHGDHVPDDHGNNHLVDHDLIMINIAIGEECRDYSDDSDDKND